MWKAPLDLLHSDDACVGLIQSEIVFWFLLFFFTLSHTLLNSQSPKSDDPLDFRSLKKGDCPEFARFQTHQFQFIPGTRIWGSGV